MTLRPAIFGFACLLAASVQARDACQLLTKQEVAAVQGEPFSSVRLTTRDGRSQCFYQLPQFVNSISLDVISGSGREFWEKNFEGEEREEEEEENKTPPKRITGVGDEAFWVGSRTAGSLYVLHKKSVLRVSIGGAGTEAEKIARSKRLAAKALRRL